MPNYITYKQADSRWGKKNYNGSSTMATAGCGPTSVAMLAYAVDGKTNPWDVALYMKKHGYAVRNHGTAWDGIPAAMKAFGLQDVKKVNVSKSMDEVWNYLSKGYCAVFLFKAGSRGGITWTTSGHYVAVTDYKVENGKHILYTRDSGGRNHTGWYTYETQMRGLIPQVWVGLVGTPKKDDTPKVTVSRGIDISEHQGNINWAKVKADGINFAVIRAGYGKNNTDAHFIKNISESIKAGIEHIYVYWFSYAYTDDMAVKEAVYCANTIAPWKSKIECVFFDWEYDSMNYAKKNKIHPGKSLITSMTKGFMDKIKENGYKAGFYYNYDYKVNHYNMNNLTGYAHWYALYSSEKQTDVMMQQYSNKGKVSGISGNVDMNWLIGGTPTPTPFKPLAVDGKFGVMTKTRMQKWLGVKQDSIVGPATIKALQAKVGANQDGKWGAKTTKKLQVYLSAQGFPTKQDGIFGADSIRNLQRYLNKVVTA